MIDGKDEKARSRFSERQTNDTKGQAILWRQRAPHGIKLLLPSFVFVSVLIILPILYDFYLTFHYVSVFNPRKPVCWDEQLHPPSALRSLLVRPCHRHYLHFFLRLSHAVRGSRWRFFSTRILRTERAEGDRSAPYLIPTVCAVFMAKWMLDPVYGIVNAILRSLGGFTVNWLGSPLAAMASAVAVNTWKFFPFVEIALSPGSRTISPTLYEAAEIDGATSFQKFVHITLPELASVMFVVALLRTIWTFNDFQLIYILTAGGPMNSTETLPLLAYREAFSKNNIGMGATVAVFMAVFLFLTFTLYYKIFDPLREKE